MPANILCSSGSGRQTLQLLSADGVAVSIESLRGLCLSTALAVCISISSCWQVLAFTETAQAEVVQGQAELEPTAMQPFRRPVISRSQALPPLPKDFPPLPNLSLPDTKQVMLPNGLRIFMLEDHEVPVVHGTLLMRGGQRASPSNKVGVATISAQVQRSGGTQALPGAQLDEALESRAASIEGGAAGESVTFGFECLTEDTRDVMGLLSDVVLRPAMPQRKLDFFRAQVLNILEHINDDASSIPRRELSQLLYGHGSVYSRRPTPKQIQSLEMKDLKDFMARWERPDNTIFGISGDFDAAAMAKLVEQKFGSWTPAPGQPQAVPPIPTTPLAPSSDYAGKAFLVDRPGQTQYNVALGEIGISLQDPDVYALDVLNDLLNSFGGRLFDQIRSREGLAYSVSGSWTSTPIDHPGLFVGGGETANIADFLRLLKKAFQGVIEDGFTDNEINMAKEQTLNGFVFNFASTDKQLARACIYALLGIPQDYLFTYKAGIEAVTRDDILQAARRHLHPEQQAIVVAGDRSLLERSLSKQGQPFEALDIGFKD
ncbi:hypothetical protein WJX84_002328 [Apatococcus fuscideae]|uniref:Uncharacterized protein n=1 Tax=Apatococcus fuscideae TaxID=2026836 RepID=A0AAW1T507_9CHLO